MNAPDTIASRLIGALFVDRGLVSESQIRVALEIQRETGEQLGQILVQRFGVSRKELARVVAEQWRDVGRGATDAQRTPAESWRPLGEIFVTRGFITEEELDGALKRQRKTGERLGEALVGLGVISKFELAGALAEQMASLSEDDEGSDDAEHGTVHQLPERSAVVEEYGATAHEHEPVETEPPVPELVDELFAEAVASREEPEPEGDVGLAEDEPTQEPVAAVEPEAESPEADYFELEPPLELWAVEATLVEEAPPVEPAVEPWPEPSAEPAVAAAESVVEDVTEPEPLYEPEQLHEEAPSYEPEPSYEFEPAAYEAAENGGRPEPNEPLPVGSWHLLVSAQAPDLGVSVAFTPTRDGYKLVPLTDVPSVGATIDVPNVGAQVVLRIGRSPLPGDLRVCVYLEEPVAPAPDPAA